MIPGPDGAAERHSLFVYGALRRGFELHHHLARLGARFVRSRSGRGADRSGTLSGRTLFGPTRRSGHGELFELGSPPVI